jgi:Uma2 family endonuclease
MTLLTSLTDLKHLTLEAFLQEPELKPAVEYIAGERVQKPMPKGRHSRLQGKFCDAVNRVSEDPRVAYAFPELRCSFGDRSIVPDVSVFLWEQIPFTAAGDVPDRFEIAPAWVVEILSPDQKANRVIGNLLHCLNFGSRLGWFLDPDDLSILVLQSQQQPRLCVGADSLPILEGIDLSLTVEQVYGWLRMQ